MSVSLICVIVSLVILVLVTVCGILGGLRKGVLRSLVKLAALLLSVVLSLVITLCLRGVAASGMNALIPSELSDFAELAELIVQIPAAALLIILFFVVFSIVRALMLIPQSIVSKLLPTSFDEFARKKEAKTSDQAPVSTERTEDIGSDTTADQAVEPMPSAMQADDASSDRQKPYRILWQVSSALCGALSALLLLGAFLMPISGTVTRGGNALYRVSDTMAQANYGEFSDDISEYSHAISTAPLFTVTDFFYGKTVFEPLTTFKTEYGKISLSDELENAADIFCDLLPVIMHLNENGNIREEDIVCLTAVGEQLTESKFMMSVGTYAVGYTGRALGESDPERSAGMQALQEALGKIMTEMTPDELSDDLKMLTALAEALADSPLLRVLTAKDAKLSLSDLADRQAMRDAFGIMYDNGHAKQLMIPLVNLGTETALQSINAEPVYSNADIFKISRDQMLEEADRLCDAAEGLAEFTQSLEAEGADLTSYKLSAAGKALDCLRESILFGNQYEALVRSLAAVGSDSEDNDTLMATLSDTLVSVDSAEQLLASAESVIDMSDALQNSDKKGSENQALVSSMETLLTNTSPEDIDILSSVAGDRFLKAPDNQSAAPGAQIIEDSMKALAAISGEGNKDAAAEAEAVQALYDLSHSSSENIFAHTSEAEIVNALLASDMALEMLSTLNSEGRDYGIRAKLTADNRANIASALEASDADGKQIVAEFFGVN